MAVELTDKDHEALDTLLGRILEWHANGTITKADAIAAIAHVFTAAAIDNAGEVQSWLHKPGTLETWRKLIDE